MDPLSFTGSVATPIPVCADCHSGIEERESHSQKNPGRKYWACRGCPKENQFKGFVDQGPPKVKIFKQQQQPWAGPPPSAPSQQPHWTQKPTAFQKSNESPQMEEVLSLLRALKAQMDEFLAKKA